MIYLDHNATTCLYPAVLDAMRPYFEGRFGNPASVHAAGRDARRAVEEGRHRVLALFHRQPGDLVFTGSGTEAVLLGMVGAWRGLRSRGGRVVVSSVEHRSGIDAAHMLESEGARVSWVGPDERGSIDPDRVAELLGDDTALVCVQHANNETGVIHPLPEIGARTRAAGARLFVDAVQSAGKIALDPENWSADYVAVAAHKLGGPKGVGALWRRERSPLIPFTPGTAERGLRGGTLNVPAIVGFGVAAKVAVEHLGEQSASLSALRDAFEARVLRTVPSAAVTGSGAERLPNTTHLTFDPEVGSDLVIALDQKGYAVSAGSACTSGSESPSHVLLAMGMNADRARTAVRVSLGRESTREELDGLVSALQAIVEARHTTMGRS